jgi:molybdate transport repressor ModE-like protein
MPTLVASPAWHLDDQGRAAMTDVRLVGLMAAIRSHGSLVAAARSVGLPYRTAWAVLADAERTLGTELAISTRGQGATLTPLALRWLDAHAKAAALLASLGPLAVGESGRPAASRKPRPLRVFASHDLALAQLRDRWRLAEGVALAFHGSGESLDAYRAGQADAAGFHYAIAPVAPDDPLLARIEPRRDALLRFITRAQGLMLPRGNPRRVRGLEDLAGKRLTIVNRQPGSGTRVLFDRLVAAHGIAPATLAGYSDEEFTHAAVAATVAAGRADAGFGIEAAAAQLGLAFVPLVRERYAFACRRRALDTPPLAAFRKLLASRVTRAVVGPLPGYRLDAPGTVAQRF